MKRNTRIILFLCVISVTGFIVLQVTWLQNYYWVNKDRFRKDVNLAFEDAVKKEFMVRCDTLESLLYSFLLDTTQISITSQWIDNLHTYQYTVYNKNDRKDLDRFGLPHINLPIQKPLDSMYKVIARWYANSYREEDLEQHIVFFNTQNIGLYITDKSTNEFSFDTARLRPIFRHYLAQKDITSPFSFYYADKDTLLNQNNLPESLAGKYEVVTKAFSTFKNKKGENYVRALFRSDTSYLVNSLKWMLASAIVLLFVIAFSLYYLFKSLRREKRLSAIKNDFISNITHELKTPVTTVSGAVEALLDFDALENVEKTDRYLQISKRELVRLSGMIDQILYSSIYEREEFELNKEMIYIDSMIHQIISSRKLNLSKEVNFTYTNSSGLEQVYADKLHLSGSISNLLDNAIKYSYKEVNIKIDISSQQGKMLIKIEDDGIGISKDYLPFVFEKFFRVPQGNQHKVKGYGLGLSYVKSIVEKHNGSCHMSSKTNQGTQFTIILPV